MTNPLGIIRLNNSGHFLFAVLNTWNLSVADLRMVFVVIPLVLCVLGKRHPWSQGLLLLMLCGMYFVIIYIKMIIRYNLFLFSPFLNFQVISNLKVARIRIIQRTLI